MASLSQWLADILPPMILTMVLVLVPLYVFYPAIQAASGKYSDDRGGAAAFEEDLSNFNDSAYGMTERVNACQGGVIDSKVISSDGNGTEKNSNIKRQQSETSAPILSLIVPSFNEEERLPVMLDVTIDHLRRNRTDIAEQCARAIGDDVAAATKRMANAHPSSSAASAAPPFEVIIVDDGSKDGTADIVRRFAARHSVGGGGRSNGAGAEGEERSDVRRIYDDNNADIAAASNDDGIVRIRLVRMRRNGGKGAAVRAGMIRSRGELCLMVDADGATDFADGLRKVLDEMAALLGRGRSKDVGGDGAVATDGSAGGTGASRSYASPPPPPPPPPPAAVFGSRAHLEEASCAERSPVRTVLMKCFHFFVRTLCSDTIRDTQCGFKLFTRAGAAVLFANLHLRRWAFDTELVVAAEMLGVPLAEVGVKWREVEGSKLDTDKITLALVSLGMLRDMVCVRACYTLGIWRAKR